MSNHTGMAYGQSISPINWAVRGNSNMMVVDDVDMFFCGLYFTLSGTLPSTCSCVCTGVGYNTQRSNSQPMPGWISFLVLSGGTNFFTSGSIGTVYTGSSIGSEPFSISIFDQITADARLPSSGSPIAISNSDQEVGITTGGGATTCTLPTIASWLQLNTQGQTLTIFDVDGHAGANNISFTPGGSDTIIGTATITTNFGAVVLRPIASTGKWYIKDKH